MDRRFIASMILKTIALILFLVSLIVNSVTLIADSSSATSDAVVFVTLILGWLIYGVDKIFIDKEED